MIGCILRGRVKRAPNRDLTPATPQRRNRVLRDPVRKRDLYQGTVTKKPTGDKGKVDALSAFALILCRFRGPCQKFSPPRPPLREDVPQNGLFPLLLGLGCVERGRHCLALFEPRLQKGILPRPEL